MIDIVFNKKEFEYDAYTLIKAFYPQEEVSILYEGEEKTESSQKINILFLGFCKCINQIRCGNTKFSVIFAVKGKRLFISVRKVLFAYINMLFFYIIGIHNKNSHAVTSMQKR